MGRQIAETITPDTWVRAVHDAHGDALLAFVLRAVGDRQAAEEVVQDTLVRAWRHAHRFDPERGSLRTWLFAIARNLVVDRHRADGARPVTAAIEAVQDLDDPSATSALDRAVEAWQVADALSRLTADHRRVIVETYYRGASVDEAAQRLGIPPGTVKSRLHYGLRSLRLVLEEMGPLT